MKKPRVPLATLCLLALFSGPALAGWLHTVPSPLP